jgi:5-methylcytosine-specific restriction endonuclease McrA
MEKNNQRMVVYMARKKNTKAMPVDLKERQETFIQKAKEVRRERATRLQAEGRIKEILEYWNSKEIIKHKSTNKRAVIAIDNALRVYEREEILSAIDRYATALHDEEYQFFNYTWTINSFLSKSNAMPDFMIDGQKWVNYCRHKAKQEKVKTKEPVKKPVLLNDGNIYRQYLTYMKAMPYEEYLDTEHWKHFRTEALRAAQYKCAVCAATGTELNVHHNNYSNRGRETFNDVVALCKVCHERFHAPDEIGTPINHAKIHKLLL